MKLLIKAFEIAEGASRKIRKALLRSSDDHFRQVERWYREDPFDLKRSSFDFLTSESVVFDLGGYAGQWSSDIAARYNCKIFIFEPVKEYAQLIQERFSKNENIAVFAKGLAANKKTALIQIDKFASRVVDNSSAHATEQIELDEFNRFISEQGINRIDLIKINIEGAEYELMEYLISTNTIKNIGAFLIQFHNFVDGHELRRKEIHQSLEITHQKVFDYPYVWELWTRH